LSPFRCSRFVGNQNVFQTRHRSSAGSANGKRAHYNSRTDLTKLGQSAGDVATPFGHQPDDEDRHFVENSIEMLNVNVVPELMAKHKVTLNEVMEATADALDVGLFKFSEGHHVGSGGWIDTPNQRLQIRHVLPLVRKYDDVTTDALANVPLAVRNGRQLLLEDVAEVVIDHQPMVGDGIINEGPGLLLIVEKFPWGNTLQVSREVEKALDALRPGLPDVEIDSTIFRPATFIEMAIDNLTTAFLISAVLVILILFAFLFEWRTALISCAAIPLSIMTAIMVLYFRGTTINTMVLAGLVIALGAVVDDAIVGVENIVRRLRQYRKEGRNISFTKTIIEASFEVRHAIIFSTLIEVGALLPVFVMEGLSGAFFKPLALSYAIAIFASTVVALTVTPAMSFLLLRNVPLEHRESPLTRWPSRWPDYWYCRSSASHCCLTSRKGTF
jgi:Cu/Ag efflux pump CusA